MKSIVKYISVEYGPNKGPVETFFHQLLSFYESFITTLMKYSCNFFQSTMRIDQHSFSFILFSHYHRIKMHLKLYYQTFRKFNFFLEYF